MKLRNRNYEVLPGSSFLRTYNAVIDYEKNTITLTKQPAKNEEKLTAEMPKETSEQVTPNEALRADVSAIAPRSTAGFRR